MKRKYPRLVIAGHKGGSGKTTLSLGLIAAWKERGVKVAPYKKGPDYIDAGWLSSAAGRLCYNLDPFLVGRERILSSFTDHFGDADCAVIEGNRGLYDGMDAEGTYSTAELAKILRVPVILIVDCSKVTRTAGALVLGLQQFDKKVDIRGVVLNRIAGSRHERIIREVIERYCGVPVVGAIPKMREDLVSERHMGLTPFQEHPGVGRAIDAARDMAMRYLDLERILQLAQHTKPLESTRKPLAETLRREVTIGIIRDSAFQFYYPENFEELERRGAVLREVSALTEKSLPPVDALYIGGGFPETNAVALAANASFRKSLRNEVEKGLPVYAECGGLMYLGRTLLIDDKRYPMAGIFPLTFSLERRPQAHGYTVVEVSAKSPYYRKGTVLKGHEFHYSRVDRFAEKKGLTLSFTMERGQGIVNKQDGICYKNVLATYTHLHAYGAPEWADGMVRSAFSYKRRKVNRAG